LSTEAPEKKENNVIETAAVAQAPAADSAESVRERDPFALTTHDETYLVHFSGMHAIRKLNRAKLR
jgi:hypothetical protein